MNEQGHIYINKVSQFTDSNWLNAQKESINNSYPV